MRNIFSSVLSKDRAAATAAVSGLNLSVWIMDYLCHNEITTTYLLDIASLTES